MITTIIFDLSEVYLQGVFGSHTEIGKHLGFPIDKLYFYSRAFNQFMLGKITEEDYWKTVIKKHSWNTTVNILKRAVRKNFTEIKGTREIIQKLKENGYTLVLLSNHGKEWAEYCEGKYSYHRLFNHVAYSYQLKLSKPNKNIFLFLLKTLRLNPKDSLFIDDDIKNILAAKNMGIKTIQFISAQTLKKDLAKLLITIE